MNDVAAAAGVARGTLYRYFSSRQDLVDELAAVAMRGAAARLSAARIGEVAPEDAIPRAIRALIDIGPPFLAVARQRVRPDAAEFEREVTTPIRGLVKRAQEEGVVRVDVSATWLADSLVGLVVTALSASPHLGREDVVEAVTSQFLDGARARDASALRAQGRRSA